MSFPGFALGYNREGQLDDRKRELEDAARKAKLKVLEDAGLSTADQLSAIDAVYHHDPSAGKQHIENLFRRLSGKQPQPVVSPAQAEAGRLAPLAAKGQTPVQQSISNAQAIQKYIQALPEDQQQQAMQVFGLGTYKPNFRNFRNPETGSEITVDANQGIPPAPWIMVGTGNTSADSAARADFDAFKKQHPEYAATFEQWKAEQAGAGRAVSRPKIRAWKREGNGFVSVEVDPNTNQIIPGTENRELAPPPGMLPRVSTGQYHWVDENNQVHETQETRTSAPAYGGAAPPAPSGAPAPRRATPHTGSSTGTVAPSRDRILGYGRSQAITKAETDVAEATKMSSLAHQVAKTHDAFNQKRLLVALERASAGRFTVQALDYVKQAGWGNTLEEWANKPGTGEIPADVLRQAVAGADENLKAAQDALAAARQHPGDSAPAPQAAPQTKGTKSLKAAMALPQNKGKSSEQVTQELKSLGYGVAP